MKTNAFKDLVKAIADRLKANKDPKVRDSFNQMSAKKQKRMTRKMAYKEVKKHYSSRKMKHFGTFSPRKPINY